MVIILQNSVRVYKWNFSFRRNIVNHETERVQAEVANMQMLNVLYQNIHAIIICSANGHLVWSAVVNGLSNFQVGMPGVLPAEGSAVDMDSYVVCGTWKDVVSKGSVIIVNCAPSADKFRYVIAQSLDTKAEKLCLAEVAVYSGGQ